MISSSFLFSKFQKKNLNNENETETKRKKLLNDSLEKTLFQTKTEIENRNIENMKFHLSIAKDQRKNAFCKIENQRKTKKNQFFLLKTPNMLMEHS